MSELKREIDGIRGLNYFRPYLDGTKFIGNLYVNNLASKPGDEAYIMLCPGQVIAETYAERYASNKGSFELVGQYTAPYVDGYANVDEPIINQLKKEAERNKGCGFEWCGSKDESGYNSKDVFRVFNEDGMRRFFEIIERCTKPAEHQTKKKNKNLFDDVREVANELYNLPSKYVVADLCARWGKTKTFMEIGEMFNEEKGKRARIQTVISYVHTCKTSYRNECGEGNAYDNCLFIDPDNYKVDGKFDYDKIVDDIQKHLKSDKKHRILYYVSNTGEDDLFNERIEPLLMLKMPYFTVIEEADYGSWRKNQVSKTRKVVDSEYCLKTYVASGTGTQRMFDALNWVGKEIDYVKRDYIMDVLMKRDNAVSIQWATIDDFKDINKDCNRVENWSTMCKLYYKNDDGEYEDTVDEKGNPKKDSNGKDIVGEIIPCNENYFKAFAYFYFGHMSRRDFIDDDKYELMQRRSKEIKDNSMDAITMIWTPGTNAFMQKLADLWNGDNELNKDCDFEVINGDTTTNADAENHVKSLKLFAKTHNKRLVLIANKMATRSFTESHVKNIVLMYDGVDTEENAFTTNQRYSRAFSQWEGHNKCYITDLRSSNGVDKFACWISQLGVSCINKKYKKTEEDVIRMLASIPKNKFSFSRHFTEDGNVFTKLSESEIREMMYSHSYNEAKVLKSIDGLMDYLAEHNKLIENFTTNLNEALGGKTTVLKREKGVGNTYKKIPKSNSKSSDDLNDTTPTTDDQVDDNADDLVERKFTPEEQNALFIYNHYKVFKHYTYTENILENEVNDILSDEETKCFYESTYNINMTVIKNIVDYWKATSTLDWFDFVMGEE